MMGFIIEKIIECESLGRKLLYKEFLNEFNMNNRTFSETLILLRDSALECVDDSDLKEKINSFSEFFSGVETVLLAIASTMMYFEIDSENTFKFIIDRRTNLHDNKSGGLVRFDLVYDSWIERIFLEGFETHNGEILSYKIEEFIKPDDIKNAEMANMYFTVMRKTNRKEFKNIPKKLADVGFLTEAITVIDDRGLRGFYKRYKEPQVNHIVEILDSVGANKIGEIISYSFIYADNEVKLKNFEKKIYNLEKALDLSSLIDGYLNQSGDG